MSYRFVALGFAILAGSGLLIAEIAPPRRVYVLPSAYAQTAEVSPDAEIQQVIHAIAELTILQAAVNATVVKLLDAQLRIQQQLAATPTAPALATECAQ